MPWTHEAMAVVHAAVAGGEPARSVAERLGASRNAVLGVVYRYRRAKDLPVVKRAAAPKAPKPPVPPKPTAYVAPKPSGISLRDGVRLRPASSAMPRPCRARAVGRLASTDAASGTGG